MTESVDSPQPEQTEPHRETAAAKRERLRQLLSAQTAPNAERPTVDVAAPKLTPAQLRLWQLEEHAPGVHDFSLAFELKGSLDTARFAAALDAVASSHAGLRCRVGTGGELVETEAPRLAVLKVDSKNLDAVLTQEAARPIDLKSKPGWRALLFECGPEHNVLLLHFHHIFADRWSAAVLITDLGSAYRAIGQSGQADLAERPVPWSIGADFDAAACGRYWRDRFTPAPATLALPLGAAPASGYAGATYQTDVPPETLHAIGEAQPSMFVFLLSSLAMFLSRHSPAGMGEDLVICTPMTGRHRARSRQAIGYFNNIVPLRVELAGDPEFGAVLDQAAGEARDAFAYQDMPFHEIASLPELGKLRLSRCLFTMQNIPGLLPQIDGIEASYWDVPNGTANFDFSLFAEQYAGGLRLIFNYKSGLYSEAEMRELADRFLALLRMAAERPSLRLSELPDWAAAAPPAVEPAQAANPHVAADITLLEERMLGLWAETLGSTAVDPETDFFAAGGDSLKAARLFLKIREVFGADLPLATLLQAATPRAIANRLADREWVAPWSSLIPVRTTGSRPPLFILHAGGGNVLTYRNLAERLSADQPVYCLQAKGLRQSESALETVEAMAAHYVKAVRTVCPKGPYFLAGYSLGGAIAYEMARIFAAGGDSVPFLGMLDHPGPGVKLTWTDWLRFNLMNVATLEPGEAARYVGRAMRYKLRKLWVQPMSAAPANERADLFEKSIRALQAYQVPHYPGHVTLFRARQGTAKIRADRYGGWGQVARGGVSVIEVAGNHSTMLNIPIVDELARKLDECLALAAGSEKIVRTSDK